MLDGKDREELHSIASAIGLKGVTRLKKADLVDAILAAAGGDGAGPKGAAKPAKAATSPCAVWVPISPACASTASRPWPRE